jgi:hypothetical protein
MIKKYGDPFMWSIIATIPILVFSWWVAYRSEWFE